MALALHRHGFENVQLLEQASEFAEIGAGVQISSNGSRVLLHYGLEHALETDACRSEGTWYRDLASDEELYQCNAGKWGEGFYGTPFYHVHRADLHRLLRDSFPSSWIRRSARVARVDADLEPLVYLDDGTSVEADVVIGADGLRSVVREAVVEPTPPHYTGFISWRTLIPAERVAHLGLKRACYDWLGPDKVVAVYWCSAGKQLNFLANVPAEDPRPESWDAIEGSQEVRRAFAGSNDTVQQILSAVENPFVTGIFDRPTPKTFVRNSVVLIGDAAHPVVPYLASGATQAMEDAHVLARMLFRTRSGQQRLDSALAEYIARRRQRVDNVQRISAQIQKLQHLRDASEVMRRNQRMKQSQLSDPNGVEMRGWLWGYDVIADTERSMDAALSTEHLENSVWTDAKTETRRI
jgi:salicylate hydroxylase